MLFLLALRQKNQKESIPGVKGFVTHVWYVKVHHRWKEGDWMVKASEPPLSGSFTEGTWASEEGAGQMDGWGWMGVVEVGDWVITCQHTCTIYSMTRGKKVCGRCCNYGCILYALTHIIIRYRLIRYQSHFNCIMSSQVNKTQWELNNDHTTMGIRRLRGS